MDYWNRTFARTVGTVASRTSMSPASTITSAAGLSNSAVVLQLRPLQHDLQAHFLCCLECAHLTHVAECSRSNKPPLAQARQGRQWHKADPSASRDHREEYHLEASTLLRRIREVSRTKDFSNDDSLDDLWIRENTAELVDTAELMDTSLPPTHQ
jgi:hypothetical protein